MVVDRMVVQVLGLRVLPGFEDVALVRRLELLIQVDLFASPLSMLVLLLPRPCDPVLHEALQFLQVLLPNVYVPRAFL